MGPFKLRDAFLKKIRVKDSAYLAGVAVKIIIVRGLPYRQIECTCVIVDSFYMPPQANEKPVVKDTNMLYLTFAENNFEGLEMYLKEDLTLHAQLLCLDPSFVYQRLQVIIKGVDLGWFNYLEAIKPTRH